MQKPKIKKTILHFYYTNLVKVIIRRRKLYLTCRRRYSVNTSLNLKIRFVGQKKKHLNKNK